MPRFHVHDTFALPDKSTFVLAGFILEGAIEAGMAVNVAFSATVKMYAEIDRVESIRRPDGDITCLCIKCSVPDEVTLWEALPLKNQTVEVA